MPPYARSQPGTATYRTQGRQPDWPIAGLILLTSLMAVVYIWRVVEVAYFGASLAEAPVASEAPLSMLLPIWVLVIANLYLGIDTSLTVGAATMAAGQLMAGW